MKKIFLSIFICGIYVSAFAQIDTSKNTNPGYSEKWEIIKGNGKSSAGKLFVTLPKGTEWDMTIYAAGTTKVLSNTSLKTSLPLPPGKYDLEINHIWIKGVLVEKGNSTRIKAGVLKITASDAWTLYDETKKTVLINTYSAQNRGLPIGKYVLTVNGVDEMIEIKDDGSDRKIQSSAGNYENWRITESKDSIPENKGELYIPMLKGKETFNTSIQQVSVPQGNIASTFDLRTCDTCAFRKYFIAKTYTVICNSIPVFDVPIYSGHTTKLKIGTLWADETWKLHGPVNEQGNYKLYNPYNKRNEVTTGGYEYETTATNHQNVPAGNDVVVPVGSYYVQLEQGSGSLFYHLHYPITIKEGDIINFSEYRKTIAPAFSESWTTKKLTSTTNGGRLNFNFLETASWDIKVFTEANLTTPIKSFSGKDSKSLDKLNLTSISLNSGLYHISFSNRMIYNVGIFNGYETRIKAGLAEISITGNWELYHRGYDDSYNPNNVDNLLYSGSLRTKIAVPPGKYVLKVEGNEYEKTIKDGEIVKF